MGWWGWVGVVGVGVGEWVGWCVCVWGGGGGGGGGGGRRRRGPVVGATLLACCDGWLLLLGRCVGRRAQRGGARLGRAARMLPSAGTSCIASCTAPFRSLPMRRLPRVRPCRGQPARHPGGARGAARRHPLRLARDPLLGVQGRPHVPHGRRKGGWAASRARGVMLVRRRRQRRQQQQQGN